MSIRFGDSFYEANALNEKQYYNMFSCAKYRVL